MTPTESMTGAPAGVPSTEVDSVGIPTPILGNLRSLLQTDGMPEAQPDVLDAPADAQVEPAEDQAAQQALEGEQPPTGEQQSAAAEDEVVVTPEDQGLYDSIADEAKKLYPGADPTMLKRWIDDKFMVKKLLAADEKKSKQISQLLKRVTKKEPPVRAITEFERSLAQPEPAAETPPAQPVQQPVAQQQPGQQQQVELPQHLRWQSPVDMVTAEEQAWADYVNPEASPQQKFEAARRLDEIRDRRAAMTVQGYLQSINLEAMIEAKAQSFFQQQFGDVIPAVRQTAAERAAQANHDFAIAELVKAGVEGAADLMKPINSEPIVFDGQVYENHPYNAVALRFPSIQNIRVTHDRAGKPYPPEVADRLTRIERYRTAAELWKVIQSQNEAPPAAGATGTQAPPAAAVQQAFQAGVQSTARAAADRARQGLNAGSGATTLAAKPAERSILDDFRESGAIDYSFLRERG